MDAEDIREIFRGLGPVQIRRMFGGQGVYRDDLMFALVAAATAVTTQAADPPRSVELREADSPFVAFNIWVKSGSAADPKGKEGLASLTATLMAGGASLVIARRAS